MKKVLLVILLLCSGYIHAQCVGACTTVTGTLTDTSGQVWANASLTITLIPPFGNPAKPLNNGIPVASRLNTLVANGSGNFTISLDDNSQITPAGTRWNFTICPNATVSSCTQTLLYISGASQNVSTSLNPVLVIPVVNTAPSIYRAYNDTEALGGQGNIYWNTISNTLRGCSTTPCTWSAIGSGGGGSGTVTSFSAGSLSPLFSSSVANATTTPALSFSLNNAPGFTLFGNMSSIMAIPSYVSVQGTDNNVLSSGTVSGVGAALCTDSNLGATTASCPGNNLYVANVNITPVTVNGNVTTIQALQSQSFGSLNTPGKSFRVTMMGSFQPGGWTSGNNETGAILFTVGGAAVPNVAQTFSSSSTTVHLYYSATCTVITAGASGTMYCAEYSYSAGVLQAGFNPQVGLVSSVNTVGSATVNMYCQYSTASTLNQCTGNTLLVEQLN